MKPVVPLAERLEIVRNVRYVDTAHPAFTNDKVAIWKDIRFDMMFKGDDWKGTEKGIQLERSFGELDVEIVYFPYGFATSSSALRRTLKNIDELAGRVLQRQPADGHCPCCLMTSISMRRQPFTGWRFCLFPLFSMDFHDD